MVRPAQDRAITAWLGKAQARGSCGRIQPLLWGCRRTSLDESRTDSVCEIQRTSATRSIYWRYQSRRAVRWAHCQMLLKNARTAPVRSVWACETSFSQRAGGSRVAGMHTDRQSKCSAHEVAVRRGSLVAVTQIASFMKAMTSPLQLSSKSSSRVNHASGCLPAMCHSTIVPVSAASDVTLVVRRGSVAASRRA